MHFAASPTRSGEESSLAALPIPNMVGVMGPETPKPISVKVLRGDSSIQIVLTDLLALTKINLQFMPLQRPIADYHPFR